MAAVIDCDVHHEPAAFPLDEALASYLSPRWRSYVETYGLRSVGEGGQHPPHRAIGEGAVARLDSVPPSGAEPGSDPGFAREQLLDEHGMTAAILNSFGGLGMTEGNMPIELGVELARAYNDWTHDHWLATDPRWRASICIPYESPDAAVAEMARCRAKSDRFVQVQLSSRTASPVGNPRYWPIFEAAVELDLPVAFHVGYCRSNQVTACGAPTYYFEYHVDFALQPLSLIPSLIFEGVFDRWPDLKVVLVELGFAWAVPLAWRLDAAWRVMAEEIPTLRRKPSEYLFQHFWFTTQPMVQPGDSAPLADVIAQFERVGFHDRLMFSSDYPHWDFDAPERLLPSSVPADSRERILARTASDLYGIPL
jgi:uncharacterized protein